MVEISSISERQARRFPVDATEQEPEYLPHGEDLRQAVRFVPIEKLVKGDIRDEFRRVLHEKTHAFWG